MRPLHSIVPPPVTGFFRLDLRSMTDYVARGHIYEIPRGTPSPIEETESFMRRYWQPYPLLRYRHARSAWPTPLCGAPLVTRSNRIAGKPPWYGNNHCTSCTALAPDTLTNQRQDPWNRIPDLRRYRTPDPVSGV